MFSREYYEIFKNNFFTEHLRTITSVINWFEKPFDWVLFEKISN